MKEEIGFTIFIIIVFIGLLVALFFGIPVTPMFHQKVHLDYRDNNVYHLETSYRHRKTNNYSNEIRGTYTYIMSQREVERQKACTHVNEEIASKELRHQIRKALRKENRKLRHDHKICN